MLPNAKETAKLLLQHVFCLHGLPRDIVSPQLNSPLICGKSFAVSSGLHLQSNRQMEDALVQLLYIFTLSAQYFPGQKVWLATQNIPLRMEFRMSVPLEIGLLRSCWSGKGLQYLVILRSAPGFRPGAFFTLIEEFHHSHRVSF